ncbi:MAG: hypothetical protein C0603_00835 [Denitrovibrio sp.]|nr:MAG: hypothetical protein C0603_00835 [Denitrovibrio sp.]
MNKIFFALIITLSFISVSVAKTGYEYELDIKKRAGVYSGTALSLDRVVIEITKMTPTSDTAAQDADIEALFKMGEDLWLQSGAKQSFILSSTYGYKRLCNAVIGFYKSAGRLYKAVPFYKRLLDDSGKRYIVDVEVETIIRLSEVYLSLGQTESAKELLIHFQKLIDEYFIVDITDVEGSDAYCVVVNSEFRKQHIRLALLDGDGTEMLKGEQEFFDFLLKFYKYSYFTPFLQLTGSATSENSFLEFDESSIADNFYYTNYQMLYTYARFFAVHGDKERALLALDMAVEAVNKNAGGDVTATSILKADSTAHKEIVGQITGFSSSTDVSVLKRVPYRYHYLEKLYKAVVLAEIGYIDGAVENAKLADIKYAEMKAYYATLPKEYSYIDRIDDNFPQQILAEAQIENNRLNFVAADKSYLRLISFYENVRESIPVEFRREFFRGYSKGAYLGLIENRAQMYKVKSDKVAFVQFLNALDMMNARQYRELSGEQTLASVDLNAIQKSLSKNELIYVVIDTEQSIIATGITSSNVGLDIIAKDRNLETSLHSFKDDLVSKNIYDIVKIGKLAEPILAPISKYITTGHIHALIDGGISVLPLDIYSINGKMLFENYVIDYMVTLDEIKSRPTFAGKSNFLGIADPIYDDKAGLKAANIQVSMKRSADISGYFNPLPETRDEVREIAAGMAIAKLLMGSEAAESILKSMPLEQYNIIHFATHGILGGEIPGVDEPALVLTGENGEDSLLTASEISALKMKAGLVVLSACNTGSGKYFRGEGITGIARAFKIAGTGTVVASLWPVDSLATKNMMELFYKLLDEGLTVSDALYKAKQQLQKSSLKSDQAGDRAIKSKNTSQKNYTGYANPYYWSAFVSISS